MSEAFLVAQYKRTFGLKNNSFRLAILFINLENFSLKAYLNILHKSLPLKLHVNISSSIKNILVIYAIVSHLTVANLHVSINSLVFHCCYDLKPQTLK